MRRPASIVQTQLPTRCPSGRGGRRRARAVTAEAEQLLVVIVLPRVRAALPLRRVAFRDGEAVNLKRRATHERALD